MVGGFTNHFLYFRRSVDSIIMVRVDTNWRED